VENRRYVVCQNEEEAQQDRQEREAVAVALKDALQGGDKSLVGNKGHRRFRERQANASPSTKTS
jgi:hypothetical protein